MIFKTFVLFLLFSILSLFTLWAQDPSSDSDSLPPTTILTDLDPLEGELEEEEIEWDMIEEQDIDNLELTITEDDIPPGKSAENLLATFWKQARFTLKQEFGYRISTHHTKWVNQRASARLETNHLFSPYYLQLDGKVSYNPLYEDGTYPDSIQDEYVWDINLRELYLQTSFGSESIKVGKQIVVWGKADSGIITDVISPRNQTEFIFTSIEDARIGQWMVVADHYTNNSQFTFIVNPAPEANQHAQPGHEYAIPSLEDQPGIQIIEEQKLKPGLENTELGTRYGTTQDSFDFALMVASLMDDDPIYEFQHITEQMKLGLKKQYHRYSMIGAGINWGKGNFVFKNEMAVYLAKSFQRNNFSKQNGRATKNQSLVAIGLDYNAAGAYQISAELTYSHIMNWEESLLIRENRGTVYFSWSKSYLHETLQPRYVILYLPDDGESIHQPSLTYDLSDQWELTSQLTLFQTKEETNSSLNAFRDRDQISVSVSYIF